MTKCYLATYEKDTFIGHRNSSSPGQQNRKLHLWSLSHRTGHTIEGSTVYRLQWSFFSQSSSINFLSHLACMTAPPPPTAPTSEALKRVYSTVGFLLRSQANEKCEPGVLSGSELFPRLYLVQEASCPSATRMLLGLNIAAGHTSQDWGWLCEEAYDST